MSIRNVLTGLLLSAVLIGLTGCSQRIGDFTMISTKSVDITDKYVKTGRFEATDDAWIILFVPTGSANMKEVVDKLCEVGGGTFATDVVLERFSWYFLIGHVGFNMEGDVWKEASIGDLRLGTELYEVNVSPDGSRYMASVDDPAKRYEITSVADLQTQYDEMTVE